MKVIFSNENILEIEKYIREFIIKKPLKKYCLDYINNYKYLAQKKALEKILPRLYKQL